MPKSFKSPFCALLITFIIIGVDQLTKLWALHSLTYAMPVKVNMFLNWTLAFNTGAAFSLFAQAGVWHRLFFIFFILIVCLILSVWFYRLEKHAIRAQIALLFIIGGALGNLVDRLRLGYVVDFIQLHIGDYYWPVFNVADSAISFGVFLLLLDLLFEKKQQNV